MSIIIILLLLLSLIVVGCSTNDNTDLFLAEEKLESLQKDYSDLESKNKILAKEKEDLDKQIQMFEDSTSTSSNETINLIDFSLDVMNSIKNKDMDTLSTYVHPGKGLRFTPYTYIDMENDQLFTAEEVLGLNGDSTLYTWGAYDGTGFPIELEFSDYYQEFVYSEDFLNPHIIGNNIAIAYGNMIDNTSTAYPNGNFIEYHFTGFELEYEGIDWKSLTLVFEKDSGDWYLVGIIHGQWTI